MWKKRKKHSEETKEKMRQAHALRKEKEANKGKFNDQVDIREQLADFYGIG